MARGAVAVGVAGVVVGVGVDVDVDAVVDAYVVVAVGGDDAGVVGSELFSSVGSPKRRSWTCAGEREYCCIARICFPPSEMDLFFPAAFLPAFFERASPGSSMSSLMARSLAA